MRWVNTEYQKYAGIFLKSTFIAKVDMSKKKPVLEVRPEYPADHDHALLRALKNAADLTDQIGKMQREEARSEMTPGPDSILSKEKIPYTFHLSDRDTVYKALLGVEALNPHIQCARHDQTHRQDKFYFNVTVSMGKAQHNFKIEETATGMSVCFWDFDTYGVKRDVFKRIVDEGLRAYEERMDFEQLETACRDLIAQADPIDAKTVYSEYQLFNDKPKTQTTFAFGPLSSVGYGGRTTHLFNGIRFAYNEGPPAEFLPGGENTPKEVLDEACMIMMLTWRAMAMGKSAADYPLLTPDRITAEIENTDFGYDM